MDLTRAKEYIKVYNQLFYNNVKYVFLVIVLFLLCSKIISRIKKVIWYYREKHGQQLKFYSLTYDEKEILDSIFNEQIMKENAERGKGG